VKTCVVGGGAIGGLLAADLHLAGADVTVVDTGAQLSAIREAGITVRAPDGTERRATDLRATGRCVDAGPCDLVILAVKAHVIEDIAEDVGGALRSDGVVLTLQNGIPWWYFQRHGGELDGLRLTSLDPDGRVAANLDPARILGCVAYPAAGLDAPGVVRHLYGRKFPVGELDGADTERAHRVAALFERAGYVAPVISDIRAEIWLKLVGVLAFNCIGAVTHSTMGEICDNESAASFALEVMRECEAVAEGLGVSLRVPLERRLEGAARVGHHRTSMLQDVEAGRPLEVEAIVGSTLELARHLGVPAPRIEALDACVRLLDERIRSGRAVRSMPCGEIGGGPRTGSES